MKIYLAAPLFNEMELNRNKQICEIIEKKGFNVYLPQRDGGLFYDLIKKGLSTEEARKKIFKTDLNAIYSCDIMLCLLDGRVLDEGMCVELGMAYANKKICIGYKTDKRYQDKYGHNIMIDNTLQSVYSDFDLMLKDLDNFKFTGDNMYKHENLNVL